MSIREPIPRTADFIEGYTFVSNSSSMPGSQMGALVSSDQTGIDSTDNNGRRPKIRILGIRTKENANNNSNTETAIRAIHGRLELNLTKDTIKAITANKSINIGSIRNILNMPGIITNIRLLLD
jgi:hypothetical protein